MRLAFAALLVVWGNAVNYFVQPMLPGGDWAAVAWGAALVAVSVLVARRLRADTGARLGDVRVALAAAVVGLVAAVIGVAILRLGPIVGPVVYRPLFTASDRDLAIHIALFLPLAAVIPEEIAFRGALLGAYLRAGMRRSLIVSSTAFALWHVAVLYLTLLQTSLAGSALSWLAAAAALLFLLLGGLALGVLRIRAGSLLAPIAAHWAFDAAVLVGLRA